LKCTHSCHHDHLEENLAKFGYKPKMKIFWKKGILCLFLATYHNQPSKYGNLDFSLEIWWTLVFLFMKSSLCRLRSYFSVKKRQRNSPKKAHYHWVGEQDGKKPHAVPNSRFCIRRMPSYEKRERLYRKKQLRHFLLPLFCTVCLFVYNFMSIWGPYS
jgi:hypothetical protein